LYSESFRRLQGVTQVISADEGWVVHNRLTHSLKVGQAARRIAEKIIADKAITSGYLDILGGLDAEVCEAAGLAHNLGHPPFGHVAEETLQQLTEDSGHFEGNAQTFRILTKIEPHSEEYRGLNLTRATLAAVTKYPRARTGAGGSIHAKYGFYSQSESDEYTFARMPSKPDDPHKTLEAEIMDFADDVTFAVHDTEDFYRAGLIPLQELGSLKGSITPETDRLVENIKRRWERRGSKDSFTDQHLEALKIVLDLFDVGSTFSGLQQERIDIKRASSGLIADWIQRGINVNLEYTECKRRVVFDTDIALQIKMLKELVWTYVIDRPSLALQQAGHRRIIKTLFYFFLKSLKRDERRAIPLQFHGLLKDRDLGKESNHRIASDIICCLTDAQALSLYRRITGADPGEILRASF
jgi:dGTPase